MSIGICTFPGDGRDAQALLSNADIAMYRAKEQGRNRFCFYSAEPNTLIARAALARSGPAPRARARRVRRLLPAQDRLPDQPASPAWKRSSAGAIRSWACCCRTDFIPLAEEIGVIVPIGYWTLKRVCERARRWQELGMAVAGRGEPLGEPVPRARPRGAPGRDHAFDGRVAAADRGRDHREHGDARSGSRGAR